MTEWNYNLSEMAPGQQYRVAVARGLARAVYSNASQSLNGLWFYRNIKGESASVIGSVYAFAPNGYSLMAPPPFKNALSH